MTTNLDRRIKRHILAPYHAVRVLGPLRLGEICANEAHEVVNRFLHRQEAAPTIQLDHSGVLISGVDYRNLMQLGYEMKTARDLLWILHKAKVSSKPALARALDDIGWDLLLPRGGDVAARCSSRRSRLYHEGMIEEVFLDSIKRRGFRPAAKGAAANLVDLRLDRDELVVALSLSGGDLFRRGYKRKLIAVASMKEDLAASATLWAESFARSHGALTGDSPVHVLVPFAGSGTLGFEAAMRFGSIPLSVLPRVLSFERFPCTPGSTLKYVRGKLQAASDAARGFTLRFADIDAEQCTALRDNAAAFLALLGAETGDARRQATVAQADVFADAPASSGWSGPTEGDAFVALNPPYGIRLGEPGSAKALFSDVGAWARQLSTAPWRSFSGYLCAPDEECASAFIQQCRGLATATQEARHGGRKLVLVAFAKPAV